MSALLPILTLLFTLHLHFTVGQIGVCYGTNGNNLPPPSKVVELYTKYGIKRMRIYEPNEAILKALRGSGIELTMGIQNPKLKHIAASQSNANAWVKKYIKAYTPGVAFRNIVIGNEISPSSENSKHVFQVMKNIDAAISSAGLGGQIKVTTSIASDMVEGSYPEQGRFSKDTVDYFRPIISFVVNKHAPIMASIYPGISYHQSPGMDIGYALLDPKYKGIPTKDHHTYKNLYYAQLDIMRAAADRIAVRSSLDGQPPAVAEIGGGEVNYGDSQSGGKTQTLTKSGNTQFFLKNLVNIVKSGKGTPMTPKQPITTFIFAMFDENLKRGPESERHFWIFNLDGTPRYKLSFN